MLLPLLLAALSAGQAGSAPTAETEMLRIDVPDDFDIGYRARNDAQQMIEMVVPPETVEAWTTLITSQMFFNAARRPGLDGFYQTWRGSMYRACPGLTDTLIRGMVDGKPALRGRLSCPNNPHTGKPENLEAVLIQGDANLMMVQVAFKHTIAPPDIALIDRITRSLKVCDQRTLTACSARKATGFLPTAR